MMLLQASEAIQVSGTVLSLGTFVMVLRLTFFGGKLVEKVDTNTADIQANSADIEALKKAKCPYPHCPWLGHPGHEPEG